MATVLANSTPRYSDEARDDALFHYTTAKGLIGILSTSQLWSTPPYCCNDESELVTGKGVLRPVFRRVAAQLVASGDQRVQIFARRGVDVAQYADGFEERLLFSTNPVRIYITSFCKPTAAEDFQHGLLSQWRGYGPDGGYAIQFSRRRLREAIDKAAGSHSFNYDLLDVHYSLDNPFKEQLLRHIQAFEHSFLRYLDDLAQPMERVIENLCNPIDGLSGGPIEWEHSRFVTFEGQKRALEAM